MGGMGKFGKENFNEGNKWRVYCKDILENFDGNYKVSIINPNDYFNFIDEPPRYKTEKEAMEFDIHKVRTSDLVIVNFNDMYSLGSMAELAIAYERRIPVIGLDVEKQKLHPWQVEMSNRIFDDIDEMLDYIEDFYLSQEGYVTNCIGTSHALARELLNKPDNFLTATLGDREYIIEDYQRKATHANMDDGVTHWTLNLRDGGRGNIKR